MSEAQLATARRYIEVGQPTRALDVLAGLDAGTATSAAARELRGYAYYGLRDWDAAARAAQEGLETDPHSLGLLYLLSLAEEQRGDLGAAEAAILAALEQEPEDAQLLCQYADLLMRGGQLEKAGRVIGVAQAADPGSPDVLMSRLSHAYLRHDNSEAQRLSEELLSMDPESAQGHRMLGALEFDRGRAVAAAERLAEAVRLSPHHEGTAESARAAREISRPVYWPVRFFGRWGVARTWIAAIAIGVALRSAGLTVVAAVFSLVWLTVCIWSWIAAARLSAKLK